jgi:hypothetical protein
VVGVGTVVVVVAEGGVDAVDVLGLDPAATRGASLCIAVG